MSDQEKLYEAVTLIINNITYETFNHTRGKRPTIKDQNVQQAIKMRYEILKKYQDIIPSFGIQLKYTATKQNLMAIFYNELPLVYEVANGTSWFML